MPSSPYNVAALAALARATRGAPVRPFRANATGPFLKPRSFDPGTPSQRAADAAADAVQRAQRDADAVRDAAIRFHVRERSGDMRGPAPSTFNGGRFSTSRSAR